MPSYDEFVPSFVTGLKSQGFFDGAKKVGIAVPDTPVNRRVVENLLTPELAKAGVTSPLPYFVDVSDIAALNKGLEKMAQSFKTGGVDRVVFMGGQRLAPLFTQAAPIYEFKAPWGMSTFDNLRYYSDNADTLNGLTEDAKAISFSVTNDVSDKVLPFPATFAEAQCQAIYAAAGRTFKTRKDAKNPTNYCQAALFIKNAKLLNILSAGECFGEMAYLAEEAGTRGADVSTMSESTVITVPTEALRRASDACRHSFDRAFLRILVERLSLANTRLTSV